MKMENNNQENAKQLEVIQAVKSFKPELIKACYAVGFWIWADFQQRLSQEELTFLKQQGFRWNKARKVWQNACGIKTRSSSGDPRMKYQVIKFSED
jgi:hypothetical protein